jgi:NAD(P)H-hydrate epimerase
VVLKGAFTVVAAPADSGRESAVMIAPFANPGLATGGTGDVLSGVIVGLMAQGLSPYDAACCGVYIHGEAAEAVTAQQGRTGLAASDLLEALPKAMDSLRRREANQTSALGLDFP